MSNTSKSTVVLDAPSNWIPWLFIVKEMATGNRVWEYINPDIPLAKALPVEGIEPEMPLSSHVNSDKSLLEFTVAERDIYKLLLEEYRLQLTAYEKRQRDTNKILDSLATLRTYIVTSIAKDYISYITEENTVHSMLLALKRRLAPTDQARKMEVALAYAKLKLYNKREDVEHYLREWEIVYTEAKKLNILEVFEERPYFDFSHALRAIDSSFATSQEYDFEKTL
jgi:hypothetical protein